jgi:hypothetical protein
MKNEEEFGMKDVRSESGFWARWRIIFSLTTTYLMVVEIFSVVISTTCIGIAETPEIPYKTPEGPRTTLRS